MRRVNILANVSLPAAQVYDLLCDFSSYPTYMESVRSVTLQKHDGDTCTSSWEVEFRDGLLKWTEHDVFHKEKRLIEFSQIDGDLDEFSGHWQVHESTGGSTVEFESTFDLGIPSLAEFLEPVAQRVLQENIESIIHGLFGRKGLVEFQATEARS